MKRVIYTAIHRRGLMFVLFLSWPLSAITPGHGWRLMPIPIFPIPRCRW